MNEHPLVAQLSPGSKLVIPFSITEMTWGDLREYVNLGTHYEDGDEIEWDMTDHLATNGAVTEPNGVVIRKEVLR